MTRLQLRTRLFERLGEDPASPQFWTATEANEALTAAETVLALLTLTARKVASITTGADVFVDLISALPDIVVPLAIRAGGVKVAPTSLTQLAMLNRSWPAAEGTPQRYALLGANVLALYPHQDAQSLSVEYAYIPAAMSSDSAAPVVRAALHDALVDYAAWRMRLKEGAQLLKEAEPDLRRFFEAVQQEAALVRNEARLNQYDATPPEVTLAKLMEASRGR